MIVGVGGFFVFRKLALLSPPVGIGKCGDDICSESERANSNVCPSDCLSDQSSQPSQTSSAPHAIVSSSRSPTPAYGLFQLYGDEYRQFRTGMKFSLSDYWNFVNQHVARLNIRFTRTNVLLVWAIVEPTLGKGYDWNNEAKTDAVIRATYAPAPGKQMDMLLVLDPARTKGVPVEIQKSYPYGRETEWQTFVRAAVERYDGDGISDVDSSVRVKYWQVMNEPFVNLDTGNFTVDEYAKLVKLTAQAIREADPEASIVLGDMGKHVKQIIPLFDSGDWFDAVDTHFYPAGEDYLSPAVPIIRQLLDAHGYKNAEVWLGEVGFYVHTPGNLPARTASEQARIIVKAMLTNRALGAARLLLVNLVSWSNFSGDPQNIFNFMGLISSGTDSGDRSTDLGRERIAYYAYKRLITVTETDVAELIGPHGNSTDSLRIIEFRHRADGQTFFIAWSDDVDMPLNLPWNAPRATITNLVPDTKGNFTENTANVKDGLFSITVGRDPLLIEAKN